MSDLKRTPKTTAPRPAYADRDDVARDRRELLLLLGKGLAGLPLLGLASACGGEENIWTTPGDDVVPEPDPGNWVTDGLPWAPDPEAEDPPEVLPEPDPEPWAPDGLPGTPDPEVEAPPETPPEPAPEIVEPVEIVPDAPDETD
jgi:hypothetical protein